MSGQREHRDPDELSVPEKILRVQDVWDEIARSPRDAEITQAQRSVGSGRLEGSSGASGLTRACCPTIRSRALRANLC